MHYRTAYPLCRSPITEHSKVFRQFFCEERLNFALIQDGISAAEVFRKLFENQNVDYVLKRT